MKVVPWNSSRLGPQPGMAATAADWAKACEGAIATGAAVGPSR